MALSSWLGPATDPVTAVGWRTDVPRVTQVVMQRLTSSPYLALRKLVCHFDRGVLTLRGRVPTYYLRQQAWALVTDIKEVVVRIDKIEVVGPASKRRAR